MKCKGKIPIYTHASAGWQLLLAFVRAIEFISRKPCFNLEIFLFKKILFIYS